MESKFLTAIEQGNEEEACAALDVSGDIPTELPTTMIEKALSKTPRAAIRFLRTPSHGRPTLAHAIEHGEHTLAAAIVNAIPPGDGDDEFAAHAMATAQRTWFELAADHGARQVALAFVRRSSFDGMQRSPDGRTMLERALSEPADSFASDELIGSLVEAMPPMSCISDGRTVFEKLLESRPAMVVSLVRRGLLRGNERLSDGTTAIEKALEGGNPERRSVAIAMAECGGVDPHACSSTGVGFFERMIGLGEIEVATKLASLKEFNALERTIDGRTLFELALDKGATKVVMASLGSGAMPTNALLSNGKTPFERVLRTGSKELIFTAFAGAGLKPTSVLPPEDKTVFELAIDAGATEFAFILARFAGLDGLHVLADGRTCFERAIASGKNETVAVAMVEAGSVTPTSRLPNGSTCLEFAASSGARLVCEALAKRV